MRTKSDRISQPDLNLPVLAAFANFTNAGALLRLWPECPRSSLALLFANDKI
jgi:hypothetical protein